MAKKQAKKAKTSARKTASTSKRPAKRSKPAARTKSVSLKKKTKNAPAKPKRRPVVSKPAAKAEGKPAPKKAAKPARAERVTTKPAPKKAVKLASPKPAPVAAPATPTPPKLAQPALPQVKSAPKVGAVAPPAANAAASAAKLPPRVSPEILSKVKPLPRKFLFDLCHAIREVVEPLARSVKGREVVSTATSGDATFEIDRVAEKALLQFLRRAKAPVAYYSEDSGYSTFSNAQPKNLLVVDPIDGTRAAKSGFEGCVISVATTRVIERPVMADVDNACVMEIMSDRVFYAERGGGARVYTDGHIKRPKLSTNTDLETLSWSMTVPARPAELIFPTAARLIDLTSLKGGFFSCNSTSFSLTRLLTNQLDACVDFASRYMKEVPELVRDYFINAGRGAVIGVCPYDMVASLLIAQEAGCIVTDAFGRDFNDVLLLDSSEHNHQSIIAAGNRELHEKLLRFFETRIAQFEELLRRRHALKLARQNKGA